MSNKNIAVGDKVVYLSKDNIIRSWEIVSIKWRSDETRPWHWCSVYIDFKKKCDLEKIEVKWNPKHWWQIAHTLTELWHKMWIPKEMI